MKTNRTYLMFLKFIWVFLDDLIPYGFSYIKNFRCVKMHVKDAVILVNMIWHLIFKMHLQTRKGTCLHACLHITTSWIACLRTFNNLFKWWTVKLNNVTEFDVTCNFQKYTWKHVKGFVCMHMFKLLLDEYTPAHPIACSSEDLSDSKL